MNACKNQIICCGKCFKEFVFFFSFVQNFRLNKDAFVYVLNSIQRELKVARRSTSIPNMIKLGAALKLLGQGGYQHQIGQDHFLGLSQQSMSRCLIEVCTAIEKILCEKHISFDMSAEKEQNAKRATHVAFLA